MLVPCRGIEPVTSCSKPLLFLMFGCLLGVFNDWAGVRLEQPAERPYLLGRANYVLMFTQRHLNGFYAGEQDGVLPPVGQLLLPSMAEADPGKVVGVLRAEAQP